MLNRAVFPNQDRDDLRWVAAVAKLFDVPATVVRQMASFLEDTSCWMISDRSEIAHGHKDLRIIRIPAGPRRNGAEALLARGIPGMVIEPHVHTRDEHTLVLRGAFEEDGRNIVGRGDLLVSNAGSSHTIRIVGNEDCVCAVLLSPSQGGGPG